MLSFFLLNPGFLILTPYSDILQLRYALCSMRFAAIVVFVYCVVNDLHRSQEAAPTGLDEVNRVGASFACDRRRNFNV